MAKKIFPLRKNNRFYAHNGHMPESFFFGTLPSCLRSLLSIYRFFSIDRKQWIANDIPLEKSIEPVLWWIGHASFLLQIAGINILIDPLFGCPSILFPRFLPAGIPLRLMPKIDVVLISHNHWDHLDWPSLRAIKHNGLSVLVPHGDKESFDCNGFGNTTEHMWWDSFSLDRSSGLIRFTFLPAVHWSARGLLDKNRSLWGSWMIQANGHTIYFAGDTAYSDHFEQIRKEFPAIDVALMPIAPGQPRERMRHTHLCARQSVQAFIDLQAEQFIPMHWGTFCFGVDRFHEPVTLLQKAWDDNSSLLTACQLCIPKVGQRIIVTSP